VSDCLLFDAWGVGVSACEYFESKAPHNGVLASEATYSLTKDQYELNFSSLS